MFFGKKYKRFAKLRKLPVEPEMTSPSSAEMTTQLTGWSWPVRTARGVGESPSPTICWDRAFQCHSSTVLK